MRRKKFIRDEQRQAYFNAIYNRIRRGKSVLLVGRFGSGKSTLLSALRPRTLEKVEVESLAPVHLILASVLEQCQQAIGRPSHYQNMVYLRRIYDLRNIVIVIDEANDLNPKVWPFFKRIMNAGVPMILAGLPQTQSFLKEKHEDILSRMKVLNLTPLGVDAWKENLKTFEPDALEILFGASGGNMRILEEKVDDCMDKARELKVEKVGAEIAAMFI